MWFAHSLDMRYSRQAFETEVDLAGHPRDVEALRAAFLETYGRRYGHADPDAEIEVVNVRTAAIGITPRPEIPRYRGAAGTLEQAVAERRRMVVGGCGNACPVYDRERLPKDARFEGPAIVEEGGATTVIFPGWRAAVDPWGNLRLTAAG